jgi:hypothetical protein
MQIPNNLFSNLRMPDMLTLAPIAGFFLLQANSPVAGMNLPAWIISVAGAAMAIVRIYLWLAKELKEDPNLPVLKDILATQQKILETQNMMAQTLAVLHNTVERVSNEYVDRIGERVAADAKG